MMIRLRHKGIFTGVYIAVFCLCGWLNMGMTVDTGDVIKGTWMTESKESKVEIYRYGNKFYGRLAWLKYPIDPETKKPKTDKHNPDTKLRNRPIIGLQLVNDFIYDPAEKEWSGGTIYDPKSGNTYNCKASLTDANTLKVRGYIGYSWMGLGRTEIWMRAK